MSHPEVHQFGVVPITAHSFSADRQQVAICQNTDNVQIYNLQGDSWALEHTLTDHDKLVTSIDIAPKTGRILTCSQDRNAYVWTFDSQVGLYKPTLVLLRINRAATFARWSPNEDKFAVASGARCISVCYFEEDNDWWVSKHIKKPIRSTVLSIDWHPNNVLLASGSADMKARVFSAYVKGVDKKPPPSVWGDKLPFNTVCGEFSNGTGGWIHSVAFSPSGDALAFTGHDSSINIAYPAADGGPPALINVRTGNLPLLSLMWQSETRVIAVGHDCSPMLFETANGADWHFSQSLDQGKKKSTSAGSALNKFRQLDSRGLNDKGDTELNTTHQNSITQIRPYAGSSGNILKYSTTGVDGRLVIWSFDPAALAAGMAGLSV